MFLHAPPALMSSNFFSIPSFLITKNGSQFTLKIFTSASHYLLNVASSFASNGRRFLINPCSITISTPSLQQQQRPLQNRKMHVWFTPGWASQPTSAHRTPAQTRLHSIFKHSQSLPSSHSRHSILPRCGRLRYQVWFSWQCWSFHDVPEDIVVISEGIGVLDDTIMS